MVWTRVNTPSAPTSFIDNSQDRCQSGKQMGFVPEGLENLNRRKERSSTPVL
jgi:hypothetical protein